MTGNCIATNGCLRGDSPRCGNRSRRILAVYRGLEDDRRLTTMPKRDDLRTVREYLRTGWSPDRVFVDGRID